MVVQDEVSCILQVASEYLKQPCPITSLSGSQEPHLEALKQPHGVERELKKRREAHQVSSADPTLFLSLQFLM